MDDATNNPEKDQGAKRPAEGRDAAGRFAQGGPGGPGRRRKAVEAALAEELQAQLNTGDDWAAIVRRAIRAAKRNDYRARQWLSDYGIGRPKQNIGISRDVSEDTYPEFEGLSIEEIRAIARGEISSKPGGDVSSEE